MTVFGSWLTNGVTPQSSASWVSVLCAVEWLETGVVREEMTLHLGALITITRQSECRGSRGGVGWGSHSVGAGRWLHHNLNIRGPQPLWTQRGSLIGWADPGWTLDWSLWSQQGVWLDGPRRIITHLIPCLSRPNSRAAPKPWFMSTVRHLFKCEKGSRLRRWTLDECL